MDGIQRFEGLNMMFSLNGVFPNKSGYSRRHAMVRPGFSARSQMHGSSQFGSGFRELQTFRSFHQNPNQTFYRFKFCKVELCTCMCERTPTLGLPTYICTNCPGRVVVLPWRTTRHEPPARTRGPPGPVLAGLLSLSYGPPHLAYLQE